MSNLTPKQARFADEYLIDLNATAAYKRAGYVAKGNAAEVNATRLLRNAQVQEYLSSRMKAREQRIGITQDRVLQELARIAFFDIRKLYNPDGSLKRPDELDDDAAAVLVGIDVVEMASGGKDGEANHVPMFTKKAKVADKNNALTLAMRHLGMLTDKLQHSGDQSAPIRQEVLIKTDWAAIHERVRKQCGD